MEVSPLFLPDKCFKHLIKRQLRHAAVVFPVPGTAPEEVQAVERRLTTVMKIF